MYQVNNNNTVIEFTYYAVANVQGSEIHGYLNGDYFNKFNWNTEKLLSKNLMLFDTERKAQIYVGNYNSNPKLKRVIERAREIAIIKLEWVPVNPTLTLIPKERYSIDHTVYVITGEVNHLTHVLDMSGDSPKWISSNGVRLLGIDCINYINFFDVLSDIALYGQYQMRESTSDQPDEIVIQSIRVTETIRSMGVLV